MCQILERFYAHILDLRLFPLNSKQYFHKAPCAKDLALGISDLSYALKSQHLEEKHWQFFSPSIKKGTEK